MDCVRAQGDGDRDGDGDGGGKGGRRRWEQMAPKDRWGPGVDNNAGGIWLRNPCGDGQGCDYRACRDLNLGFFSFRRRGVWGARTRLAAAGQDRVAGQNLNRRGPAVEVVRFVQGGLRGKVNVVQPGRLATAGNVKSGRPMGVVQAVEAAACLGLGLGKHGKLPFEARNGFFVSGSRLPGSSLERPAKQPRQAMSSWSLAWDFRRLPSAPSAPRRDWGRSIRGGCGDTIMSGPVCLSFLRLFNRGGSKRQQATAVSLVTAKQAAASNRGSDGLLPARWAACCWVAASAKPSVPLPQRRFPVTSTSRGLALIQPALGTQSQVDRWMRKGARWCCQGTCSELAD